MDPFRSPAPQIERLHGIFSTEIPVALGAWRMSQKRVLTRRVPAIETLGSATVLCVDKTGTLTLNRMSVSRIFVNAQFYDVDVNTPGALPKQFHETVRFAVLASETNPFDPMEKAFKEIGDRYLDQTQGEQPWSLVHEYSLSPELLAMSHVWQSSADESYIVATKGAPESVAELCHFDPMQRQRLSANVDAMAADGLRVLAIAKSRFQGRAWPDSQHDFDFEFLGLIGLSDPIRPSVPAALRECYSAGIKVVMITGDYPSTAQAVARKLGFNTTSVVSGSEIERMASAELRRRIPKPRYLLESCPSKN